MKRRVFLSANWRWASFVIAMLMFSGCSDDGGGDGNNNIDTSSSTDSGIGGSGDSSGDSASDVHDSASESGDTQNRDSSDRDTGDTDSSSSISGELLRLSGLPNFHVPLPASLSHATTKKKALIPEELDEVQSEGYYQLQDEHIFSDEIYGMRGLITFLEAYTQANSVPEDEVVTLGIQTGVLYEGGPMDGQPVNPHMDMVDTANSYEGIDLGKLRWWKEGDVVHIAWHIADSSYAAFPLWAIDIQPSPADASVNLYRIAAYREQWDGTQTTVAMRYLAHDEGSAETAVFQRDVGYNNDMARGDISYRFMNLKHEIDMSVVEPDTSSDTESLADTATGAPGTDSNIVLDTNTADTVPADTNTATGMHIDSDTSVQVDSETSADTSTESGQMSVAPMTDVTVIYLENGAFDPADMSQYVSSQIAAVGNDAGGGIEAFSVPALMWEDDGSEVIYHYYYREIYNSAGNLVTRVYSKKFDDYCELTDFSGFLPDVEAMNYFEKSPVMAPQVIYRRYEFNFSSSESTYAVTMDDPSENTWTPLSLNDAVLRTIWKQNTVANSPWTSGDVVYQTEQAEDIDCSVPGETACTISLFRPYATYPMSTNVFGREFYAEKQWPVRYLNAADSMMTIKVDILDEWPYLRTWLESDDNDVYDADELLLPANVFDVYYYTTDGYLVESTMPMVYRAADVPPDSLTFDADAANTTHMANAALNSVLTNLVPNITVPHQMTLPSQDDFIAMLETSTPDTDTGTDSGTGRR